MNRPRKHEEAERRLVAAGYKRLPRLWVPAAVCDRVIAEALEYGDEVKAIRRKETTP